MAAPVLLEQYTGDSPPVIVPEEREHDHARLHDPKLPRNKNMDLYHPDNAIEIALTQEEVHTYYKIMRCLVKNKDFFLTEDKDSNHCVGISKNQLLRSTLQDDHADVFVKLKTSKAKAVQIKHTLILARQIGLHNESELKQAVGENYLRYCRGK